LGLHASLIAEAAVAVAFHTISILSIPFHTIPFPYHIFEKVY
jgi:hypothetical protein